MKQQYLLRKLVFAYADKVVLNIEHQVFAAGTITALLGANGSGKSTLLGLLAFILRMRSGEIEFAGEKATEGMYAGLRRRVGLVPQNPYLIHGSVARNIGIGLKFHGVGRVEREHRIKDVLELFKIQDLADRVAKSLSGGETQKVAIARMLVLSPEVLLLDEPFTYLEQDSIACLEILIKNLRDENKTVIFTTHDQAQAEKFSEKILALADGKLIGVG